MLSLKITPNFTIAIYDFLQKNQLKYINLAWLPKPITKNAKFVYVNVI